MTILAALITPLPVVVGRLSQRGEVLVRRVTPVLAALVVEVVVQVVEDNSQLWRTFYGC